MKRGDGDEDIRVKNESVSLYEMDVDEHLEHEGFVIEDSSLGLLEPKEAAAIEREPQAPSPQVQERLRAIPSVQTLSREMEHELPEVAGIWIYRATVQVLDQIRRRVRAGDSVPEHADIAEKVRRSAIRLAKPSLQAVINATGVVIHTNLGRAPLPEAVMEQVRRVSTQYSTLEYRLDRGRRGSRHDHAAALLAELCGAEAAMVVNNNAAAVLLTLSALCRGKEAIVSRGQLVEIGGSFRIPEVMALSGAVLREVGATNKTHIRDYEAAVSEATGLIVKVHTSNFRLVGFAESPSTRDLAGVAHRHGLSFIEDLGSGSLVPLELDGYAEPTVASVVADGADVVTFSGDKLLGGPQAGLIVGKTELIDRLKQFPLARAVRVDKMTLAALEAVLRVYREGRGADLPLWRMLSATDEELHRRAGRLARAVKRQFGALLDVSADRDRSEVGGGSMPGTRLDTWVVRMVPIQRRLTLSKLERGLRRAAFPVIARIHQDALLFDVRTILPGQDPALLSSLAEALGAFDQPEE